MAPSGTGCANHDEWSSAMRENGAGGADAELAIARVLDAERGARAAVESAQREAEVIRADARALDKRIAERAAARIATIRAGVARNRSARVAALEAEAVGPDPRAAQDEAARARLATAVAQLAEELIRPDAVQE
jgi:hypothetical protein